MSQAVPLVRRLYALVCSDGAGTSRLHLSAAEPSREAVDAAEGVLILVGMLKGDAADLALPIVGQLPHQPRYDLFTGVSDADGVAAIKFDPPFATAPKSVAMAVPNTLAGPVKAEIVASSLTKAGCRVRVTTSALVTGAVTALAGAAVTVIAIGA